MKFDYLEISELKTLFDAGALKTAIVTKSPMEESYMLQFDGKTKALGYIFKGQRDKDARLFKSIDAAVKNAQKIGFQSISVKLSN